MHDLSFCRGTLEAVAARLARRGFELNLEEFRALDAERRAALDGKAAELGERFRSLLASVPNTPHESVPAGHSEQDNVEILRWGQPRRFDFEPKAHWDLGPEMKIPDLERAAKITGARDLKEDLVLAFERDLAVVQAARGVHRAEGSDQIVAF